MRTFPSLCIVSCALPVHADVVTVNSLLSKVLGGCRKLTCSWLPLKLMVSIDFKSQACGNVPASRLSETSSSTSGALVSDAGNVPASQLKSKLQAEIWYDFD